MLRKIRIILAALSFVGITLLLVGIGRDWWGWLPKLQMMPATLRLIGGAALGNIAVVLGILLVTLLAGRIYCSVICPLGVFQDIVLWIRRTLGKVFPKSKALRKRFKFNRECRWVRYPVAALAIAGIISGLQIVVALLEPYSAYGRMIRSLVGGGPAPLLIAAGVTFVAVVLCAWLWGRAYCNTICPVGTILGCVSRYQLFGVKVDEDKCIKCGACSRICKSSCIEEGTLKIDYSRCVDCFDCIGACKQGAIGFGRTARKAAPSPLPPDSQSAGVAEAARTSGFCGRPWPHEWEGPAGPKGQWEGRSEAEESGGTGRVAEPVLCESGGRRRFLATGAMLIGTGIAASAQNMKLDGGLAELQPKTPRERNPRLVPPGATSLKAFYDSCTACQLCITHCESHVLRPSTDLEHFLQPQMGYENGFCRPECTACSEVCPAGAIRPVAKDAKTLIRIGTAKVNPFICLSASGEERCGACARHCPTGAISMVDVDGTLRPVVAEEQCIGCGKCEYLCPVRPESAISVVGLEEHIMK
jgi:ferredoxin